MKVLLQGYVSTVERRRYLNVTLMQEEESFKSLDFVSPVLIELWESDYANCNISRIPNHNAPRGED